MKAKLSKILPMVLAVVLAVGMMPAIAIADAEVAVDGDPAVVLSDQGEGIDNEADADENLEAKEIIPLNITASAPSSVRAAAPDEVYINVQKTFKDLTDLSKVPNFAIVIEGNGSSITLGLNDKGATKTATSDGYVVTWKVPVGVGTYTVSEKGAVVPGLKLTADANGVALTDNEGNLLEKGVQVTTKGAIVEEHTDKIETSCASTNWDLSNNPNAFFIVSCTSQLGYVVWSAQPLSASERAALMQQFGDPQRLHAATDYASGKLPFEFYSTGEALEQGISKGDGMIKYNTQTKTLEFYGGSSGGKSVWQMWGRGTYTVKSAESAAIDLNNSYKPLLGKLAVSKTVTGNAASTSTHYAMQISGLKAGASYDVAVSGGTDSHPATITASSAGVAEITLCHGETAVVSGIVAGTAVGVTEVGLEQRSGQTTVVDVNGTEVASYGYNGTQGYVEDGSTLKTKPAAATIAADATQTVAFANDMIVEPDTGFGMDVLPFALVLILAMAGFGFYFISGRNRLNLKGSSSVWKE